MISLNRAIRIKLFKYMYHIILHDVVKFEAVRVTYDVVMTS